MINSVRTCSSAYDNKSINSDSKGKKKRGRGRPCQAGKLPRHFKGKLIKNSADFKHFRRHRKTTRYERRTGCIRTFKTEEKG